MGVLSRILRATEDSGLMFWCPGCNSSHRIQHGAGDGPRWSWNGDSHKPTFTPSVLVRSGHHIPGGGCWCKFNAEHVAKGMPSSGFGCFVCHSYITDGRIQFLSDCTHALAGQTVDLPEWD